MYKPFQLLDHNIPELLEEQSGIDLASQELFSWYVYRPIHWLKLVYAFQCWRIIKNIVAKQELHNHNVAIIATWIVVAVIAYQQAT